MYIMYSLPIYALYVYATYYEISYISRLTIVSHEAKKKQAVHNKLVS